MKIKAAPGVPEINLSLKDFTLEIKGNSFSENVNEIYRDIIKIISEEVPKTEKDFKCYFNLSVFNSVTYKNILQILSVLQNIKSQYHINISVFWHYGPDDEDTKSIGEDIKELFDLNIELIENKN